MMVQEVQVIGQAVPMQGNGPAKMSIRVRSGQEKEGFINFKGYSGGSYSETSTSYVSELQRRTQIIHSHAVVVH